jgi:hypothetical protein
MDGWRGSAWGGGRDKLSREIQNWSQKGKRTKKEYDKKIEIHQNHAYTASLAQASTRTNAAHTRDYHGTR